MKVIKQGQKVEKTRKVTCYGCKSKLEYTSNDVQSDRDGKYIVCPVCGKFIETN